MGEVLPLRAENIPAVAGLFTRVFDKRSEVNGNRLTDYLQWHYLDAPGCDPEIRPLVYVDKSGAISGFVGANVLPMTYNGRRLRAAICGSLMVENRKEHPLAGAKLLKAFLAGPQDLSFSETASEVSTQMWTQLRGDVLPQYSLDWVRIIRPVGFMVEMAASRLGPARMFKPLARPVDRYVSNRRGPHDLRWSGISDEWGARGVLKTQEVDVDGFARLIPPLIETFQLRPDWQQNELDHVLSEAVNQPNYGDTILASVNTNSGKPVGAFIYYLQPGGIGKVLQIFAHPKQAGPVIDNLLSDAASRGAVALRGRTQPALLEAMMTRRIAFLPMASTVVHSRDKALVEACKNSKLFFNGLAGEHWSGLTGGRF